MVVDHEMLQPFRGQVKITSLGLAATEHINAVCCVDPFMIVFVLLKEDLRQILRVPLKYLTVCVCSDPQRVGDLHVQIHTRHSTECFLMTPPRRVLVREWAMLLSICNVAVHRMLCPLNPQQVVPIRECPNVLNGMRPLVYWIH